MAQIKQVIPNLPEPAIASYDYFDIADGSGIIEFFLSKAATGDATYNHILTTNSNMYSESNGVTAGTGSLDLDFDITFNKPKIIDGNLIFMMPVAAKASSGTVTIDLDVEIRKWDGTSETVIGTSINSPDFSTTTTSQYVSQMRVIIFSISKTKFKAGETLRINVQDNVSGSGAFAIGHSPVGSQRVSSGQEFEDIATSRASVLVPFKIQL